MAVFLMKAGFASCVSVRLIDPRTLTCTGDAKEAEQPQPPPAIAMSAAQQPAASAAAAPDAAPVILRADIGSARRSEPSPAIDKAIYRWVGFLRCRNIQNQQLD
jgi:hypothetical protein